MKTLHVSQPVSEGTAAVVLQLARAGREAGHQVAVATPAGDGLPDRVGDLGIAWIPLEMSRAPSVRDLGAILRLRSIMRGYDVVHLHSSKAGAVGRIASAFIKGTPAMVFTPHGWSWYVGGRLGPVYRLFERWAARRADAIVAVSKQELGDGAVELGLSAHGSPLRLIQNGVDVTRFAPTEQGREAGLVVCVGRLSRQKGQDRLIRALVGVPSARLQLVGDGPDREDLQALAAEIGVGDRVEFVGVADPRPYLHAAEVVAIPSRWEGLSVVMLEAMATESLIVYTDFGGSDILAGAGLLAAGSSESETVDALTRQLNSALTGEHDELRRNARRVVVEDHSLQAVNRQYLRLWEELVAARDAD